MRSAIFLRDSFQASFSLFVVVFHYRIIISPFFFFFENLGDCSSFVTDVPAGPIPPLSILHSPAFSGPVAPRSKALPRYSQPRGLPLSLL